jgi:hypothetical protein
MEPGLSPSQETKNSQEVDNWTKVGVLIGAITLVLTYLGVAVAVKWWPFEHVPDGSALPSNGQSGPALPGGGSSTLPDQAGYISRWHHTIDIGNAGVTFQQTGPVAGGSLDLVFLGSSEWGTPADNAAFSIWLSGGVPSPADCVNKSSGYKAAGTVAKRGDLYCFVDDQPPNGPIVVALEVTGVQPTSATTDASVTLNAWAWAPQ